MRRFTVRWTDMASEDLERIISFVALSSVQNALKIAERIEALSDNLHTFPKRGRVVPELARHGIRDWLQVVEPPWRLIYRIDKRRVFIVAVLDGRRSLEDVIFERLMQID